jgi:hypothetical protein
MTITTPCYIWQPLPWQAAPAWAQWAAMDRRGGWFWYEEEPQDEDGYFITQNGRVEQFSHTPYPVHWRLSLHHRPDGKPLSLFSTADVYATLL